MSERKALISDFADEVKIITPDDGYHYFFAYYDMRATGNGINERHLCHRVSFMDRLPEADDFCELGYLEDGKFVKFAETTAWNFQQGAMLQYHPTLPDTVYYSTVVDGKFVSAIHNFTTGEIRYTDRATAAVSPDGRYGLAVNFGRIFAFRAGYGYAGFVDEGADVKAPEDDGVFLVDMESGKSRLLVSYRDMLCESGFTENDKILVNHITFNTDSTGYIMLVRDLRTPKTGWDTSMVFGDLNGRVHTVVNRSYVSHYYWISPTEIMAHATVEPGKKSLYLFNTDTNEYREIATGYLPDGEPDIHCSLSPDGKYVIGDGYPRDEYRPLVAIELATAKAVTLLRSYSPKPPLDDIRCDLHARFVLGGKYISYDTTQNGKREIALFPTSLIQFD